MATINVNLEAVEDNVGTPHAEGPLHVRVTSCEQRTSKTGNEYLNWRLDPVGGDNAKPVWLITSLAPPALWNLKRFLKACKFQWNPDGSFAFEDVFGSEVIVTIQHEAYGDGISDRVVMPYKQVSGSEVPF